MFSSFARCCIALIAAIPKTMLRAVTVSSYACLKFPMCYAPSFKESFELGYVVELCLFDRLFMLCLSPKDISQLVFNLLCILARSSFQSCVFDNMFVFVPPLKKHRSQNGPWLLKWSSWMSDTLHLVRFNALTVTARLHVLWR